MVQVGLRVVVILLPQLLVRWYDRHSLLELASAVQFLNESSILQNDGGK